VDSRLTTNFRAAKIIKKIVSPKKNSKIMARAIKLLKDLSGKIGQLVFVQTKSGKTAVYVAAEPKDEPVRTAPQMAIRLAWAILAALFVQFHKTLRRSHEGLRPGVTDYNAFLSDNTKMCRVYMSKSERQNGGSILFPCQISRGSLESIYYDKNGAGVMVTDIDLGTLSITADTTISEFSLAVMTQNDDYEDGDQLSFFYGVQKIDPVTGTPRAKIKGYKMKLDSESDTLLWDVVSPLGFTTVNGYLGMNTTIAEGAAAWVHSREDELGNLKVGTQNLYVDNTLLATYMGDAAFKASADSYGGLTTKKVWLRPDADTNRVGGASASTGGTEQSQGGSQGGSQSGSGQQQGGTEQGSGTGGNTGNGGNSGNTGGNTGGSETSGTPVLTISKTGSGSATVSAGGNALNSGAEVAADTEVTVTVTPAEGQTPTATLGGNTVTLTEDSGTYTGTFQMPATSATLVINTGSTEGYGDTN
jgi:hypothetical protein